MKIEIKEKLSQHMREFGLFMIAKGLVNATFNEMLNPYNHAMSIVQVGHGAELILKARIAEEHPLLIFSSIPKSTASIDTELGIADLLEKGQSIAYSELPERLWACTGNKLPDLELYNKFGKIRNQIVHLAVPNDELSDLSLSFGYGVIEKLVNDWWDTSILEYAIEYDDAYYEYVFEQLDRLNIKLNYEVDEKFELKKCTNN